MLVALFPMYSVIGLVCATFDQTGIKLITAFTCWQFNWVSYC